MKDNLDQECAKLGLPSFQGKNETIVPEFLGKMTFFSSFGPTFPLVPPFWRSHPNKKYIFEMSINRAKS